MPTGAIVQEELTRVEGSAEGATGHHIDLIIPKQDKTVYYTEASKPKEAESSTAFYITKSLDTRQRALLEATPQNAIARQWRRTRPASRFPGAAGPSSHGLTPWTGTTRGGNYHWVYGGRRVHK